MRASPRILSGLQRVAEGDEVVLSRLRGRRLGLLAHPASVDQRLRPALAVLLEQGLTVRALFGPEHGYGGGAQDLIPVESGSHEGLAVHSLYGDSERDLEPRPEWLATLDALVIDLQDIGSRYYTYVWTAVLAMRAAAAQGVETIVLDRPNPLGGVIVEGGPQRPGYRSFVGLRDVAVRHAMTVGELCAMAREQDGLDEQALHVVQMQGWQRELDFAQTGLPWVLPSPNMPTEDTAHVYPGGCLLEGTNLSDGRGTTRPFEIWGAPFVDARVLCASLSPPGVVLRPLTFVPTFHKHKGLFCAGVQVHVVDRNKARTYELYLRAIAAVRNQAPEAFAFRTEPYEFVADRPAIDLLTGGTEYREIVEDGARGLDEWLAEDRAHAELFAEQRKPFLLYPAGGARDR